MLQKSHSFPTTVWMVLKPLVNNGIFTQLPTSTGEFTPRISGCHHPGQGVAKRNTWVPQHVVYSHSVQLMMFLWKNEVRLQQSKRKPDASMHLILLILSIYKSPIEGGTLIASNPTKQIKMMIGTSVGSFVCFKSFRESFRACRKLFFESSLARIQKKHRRVAAEVEVNCWQTQVIRSSGFARPTETSV